MAKSFEILEARLMQEIREIKYILKSWEVNNKVNNLQNPVYSGEPYRNNFATVSTMPPNYGTYFPNAPVPYVPQLPKTPIETHASPYSPFIEQPHVQEITSHISPNTISNNINTLNNSQQITSLHRPNNSIQAEIPSTINKETLIVTTTEKNIIFKPVQTKSLKNNIKSSRPKL